MNTYTIETPTLDTLADIYALHPDRAEAARLLAGLHERITAAKITPSPFLILRSGRGVEGVASISTARHVPVFPRFRPDVTPEGVTVLAGAIRERAESERVLLLQNDLAPLNAAPVEAAGWVLDAEHVMYETDLQARPYRRDPQAVEGGAEWLERPEVRALLAADGQTDYGLEEGEQLVALQDEHTLVAFGKLAPSGRAGWANLHMIGVLPEVRGKGLGTRLHAHLLALAAERFTHHGGGTGADNHAMRRIYEKNGSRHVATQMYFRPA